MEANIIIEISTLASTDLNFFSKFILEFSKDMPFFYGLFSIMFAVLLGIGAAFIRRFISNLRKLYYIIIDKLSEVPQIRGATGFGLYDKKIISYLTYLNFWSI